MGDGRQSNIVKHDVIITSSSHSDAEIPATCMAACEVGDCDGPVHPSESKLGRDPKWDLGEAEASKKMDKDFICRVSSGVPLFTEREFERKFLIPKELYEGIRIAPRGR